jgi:transposase
MDIVSRDTGLHNSWIIMDNARIHHLELTNTLCSQYGCTLKYLSPYSYMLDPVENVFSKIKTHVRSVMGRLNGTTVTLSDLIVEAISTITENNILHYFNHMMRNVALSVDRHVFD